MGAVPRPRPRRSRVRPAQARAAERDPRPLPLGAVDLRLPAPDTGNMEILAAYGTEEQKHRWLYPLMNQEIFSAYSMTEPQGGSDPEPVHDARGAGTGRSGCITGEKWFTSAGARADIIFVMCTNGMFVVPGRRPGRGDHGVARRCTTTSATTTCASRPTTCSAPRTAPRCWRSAASAAAGSTTPCAPWRRSSWPST